MSTERRALVQRVGGIDGALATLGACCAVVVEGHFPIGRCEQWVAGVYAARDVWTHDFGGEQFSLGRAFYTHLEEGRSGAYFHGSDASDARVEAHAPGLQRSMRELVERVVGEGRVTQRRGWCGPGVHVFPPGGPVAARGGACHFDTEGLPGHHLRQRRPAITLVAMLQPTETGGGLQVWDTRYNGEDHPTDEELKAGSAVVSSLAGDVVLIDSYRLHQICPFTGARDRVSATVHAAQVDAGLWECWF